MAHLVLPPFILVIMWFMVNVHVAHAVPGPPTGVNVTNNGAHSIMVRWNAMSNVSSYHVYYQKKDDSAWSTKVVHENQTSLLIDGLKPYTIYLVKIKANTTNGLSNYSVQVQATTDEAPPSAPGGLKAKFISPFELVIQWVLIPADKANGILLGYEYVLYAHQTQILKNGTVSNSTNSTQITDMERCADYIVHVRAWTAAGTGRNAVFNITNICASPKIINHKPIVLVVSNYDVMLHCNHTGFPTPSVTWTLNDRKETIRLGDPPIKDGLTGPPSKREIKVLPNGTLSFTYYVLSDDGLYTCFLNNSLGSAEANTTMVLSTDVINVVFVVNLTNEHFHADLKNRKSSRYKNLSSTIKDEVLRLYSNAAKFKIQDVEIQEFWEGSVWAVFMVVATVRPGAKLKEFEDAKNEILSTMIIETKDGTLGQIPVGHIVVKGAPLPPDAQVVSKQPTYAVLSLARPPFFKQYQITSYSIKYRKHGEDNSNTVETVKDKDGTIKGVVTGLEPGQDYVVQVKSHRYNSNFMIGEEEKYTTLEVKTPDIMMKQVMLTIVLPVGLAIIIAVIILACIRPYVKNQRQRDIIHQDNMRLQQRYGPPEENIYNITRLLEEFPCRWKEIPREDVSVGKELGAGAFGTVVRAEMKRDGKNIPCAVKMLKRFATEREHRDLFNELSIMSQVGNNTNIVSLIGACTVNGPLWVIVKLAEGGCLLEYLHKHRKSDYSDHAYMNVQPSTSTDDKLDKLQKLKFAHGIARGMKHLEKMKCVHRDLAARNVLLSKTLIPMVSDFGLSRDIYESGMYEDAKGGKRPVRWMAPESIEDYTCTPKSDVWSYGVTLWEIETAGTVPYAGVDSGMDILNEVKRGYRLEQPDGCDDDVYALMLDTWRVNPLDRPSFMEIDARVEEMLSRISEYLEIQNEEDDDTRAYDEVHISEQDLANGHVTQDEDDANQKVRYTDIQGAAASDVPPHDDPLKSHQDTSRDQDDPDDEPSLETKC